MLGGERNLKRLLENLSPTLLPGEYVYVSLPPGEVDISRLEPLGTFLEHEGLSLILRRSVAVREGYAYEGVFRVITLTVHSSLEAVGLTAAVATALAAGGISANVVAACFHDHILVPADSAEAATEILRDLGTQ